jgi:uncharacterized membrane protein YraQ (UPF0718 family)
MKKRRGRSSMVIAAIIMGIGAVILLVIAYLRGDGSHIAGLQAAWKMTIEVLPILIFAFVIAGFVQVMVPNEVISKWVGSESGFRGIFIGSIAGGLSPGGPYVSLPIAAGLFKAGASYATMVAYLTGWSLWAVGRLPMEVGILGWRLTFIRIVSTIILPPIAGLIAQLLFSASQ